MKYDVIGIGAALLDFQAKVQDKTLEDLNISKASMTLVEPNYQLELLSKIREELGQKDVKVSSGGSSANTVAGLASYGGKAAFIGKLGSDSNAQTYIDDMKRFGVEMMNLKRSQTDTGTCLALITPDAERTMLTALGAAVELEESDIDQASIEAASTLYLEGYLFDSPTAKQAALKAIDIARAKGNKVALSFADQFCVERHYDLFVDLTKSKVDYLFCNETEAMAAAKQSDPKSAFDEIKNWTEKCFVSIGPKGALASDNNGKITEEVPTWDIKLVDKIGAGDGFAAGVLFGLSHGKSLREACFMGCYSATRVIQQYSARPESPLAPHIEIAAKGPAQNEIAVA